MAFTSPTSNQAIEKESHTLDRVLEEISKTIIGQKNAP